MCRELQGSEDERSPGDCLEGPGATEFRALAVRLNFLAQGCPDIHFAAEEVCCEMASARCLCRLLRSPRQ